MLNPCKECGSPASRWELGGNRSQVKCDKCGNFSHVSIDGGEAAYWNKKNPAVAASPLNLNPCTSCFSFPSWGQSGSVSCRVVCHRAAPSGEEWNKMNPLPEMNKCSDCGEAPYLRGAGVAYAVAQCVCSRSVQAATVASAVERWNLENPVLAALPSPLNPCKKCGSQPERQDLFDDTYRMACTSCDVWSGASDKGREEEYWNEENPALPSLAPCRSCGQPECKETPGAPSAPPTCPLCRSTEIEIEWKDNLCYAVCDRCGYKTKPTGLPIEAHADLREKPVLLGCPLCQAKGETLGVREEGDIFCVYCLVSAPHENWQGFKRPEPEAPHVEPCRSCSGEASAWLARGGQRHFACDVCFMQGPRAESDDLARQKWNELSECTCEEEPF